MLVPNAIEEREVDAQLIRTLYSRVKPLLFANFGAMILMTLALWDTVDRRVLLGWGVVLGAWTMMRYGLARWFRRRERALSEVPRWTGYFVIGSGVAGCLWGSSALLVGALEPGSAALVHAFIMAALSAAAIAGYTNSLPAFAAFLVPALTPYGLKLIWLNGGPSPIIALFLLFWAALMAMMARHLNHGFRETITLSLQNSKLAENYRVQRDRAAAANRAKSRFLGHMSHELRTPLNAVIGYADMMRHKMLGPLGAPAYERYADAIHESGGQLLTMIDQLLDIARLEDGETGLAGDLLDAPRLLHDIAATHRTRAEATQVGLSVSAAADLPRFKGDSDKCQQMIGHLVENAIDASPPGETVDLIAGERGGGLVIGIIDRGPGMPDAILRTLSHSFAKAESSDHMVRSDPAEGAGHGSGDRGKAGLGLGLTLAKLLANAHEAQLAVHSFEGAGTSVEVHFPAARDAAPLDRVTG